MSQVVIENPIINSPFAEPNRHFKFTDEGITNEEVEGRRTSAYFIPIAAPKKKGDSRPDIRGKPYNRKTLREDIWLMQGKADI